MPQPSKDLAFPLLRVWLFWPRAVGNFEEVGEDAATRTCLGVAGPSQEPACGLQVRS